MWFTSCLHLALLATGALSYPVDIPPTGHHSTPTHSNNVKVQTDAPFYLQQLISPEQVTATRDQLKKLQFQYSWKDDASGKGVVVYVVDSGIDIDNPEFEGRATNGWSLSGSFIDHNGHGTICASIVGGRQFGVAKNVRIVAVKVGDEIQRHWQEQIQIRIKGLQYVLEECQKGQHACIVCMSMVITSEQGTSEEYWQFNRKVEELINAGIHVVGIAGNGKTNIFPSLADVPGTITVAALDCHYRPAHFSNYGRVDIWAVGDNIKALVNDNYWDRVAEQEWAKKINLQRDDYVAEGTSLAAPQVAGIIAIIISVHGNKPPAEMKQKVINMGIHNQIQGLRRHPWLPRKPYGPNVMAHIPKELYSGGLAA